MPVKPANLRVRIAVSVAFAACLLALAGAVASTVHLLERTPSSQFTAFGVVDRGKSVSLVVENRENDTRQYTVETRVLHSTFWTDRFILPSGRDRRLSVPALPSRKLVNAELMTPGAYIPYRSLQFALRGASR